MFPAMTKWLWWGLLLASPLLVHVAIGLRYAYGQYDGKHCMGLLDAVPICTKFEYYVDALFNGFALFGLAGFYGIFFVVLICVLGAKVMVARMRERKVKS